MPARGKFSVKANSYFFVVAVLGFAIVTRAGANSVVKYAVANALGGALRR